jgi:hypothetical protein
MNIISRKSALLCGAASIAMMGIVPANAQDSTAADEQVTVSASRISIAGYQQPTPVTVVGAAQLERDANTDIGNSIRELPALGASSGPDNGVGSGLAATWASSEPWCWSTASAWCPPTSPAAWISPPSPPPWCSALTL